MNLKTKTYYSNGKLLLTGEYVVLDGALSLALPTKLGQSLTVAVIDEPKVIWKSLDDKGSIWFEDEFLIENTLSSSSKSQNDVSNRLIQILQEARKLNPKFLSDNKGFVITTQLDFSKNWGLGTSSTLINNIANWAKVDAFDLLKQTFGGSGYDIACAEHNSAITYQLLNKNRSVCDVNFNPSFKKHLYFVYLNKKQNSRDGISLYKTLRAKHSQEITAISEITSNLITCKTLEEFELLIEQHEQIISKIINQRPVKELLFKDFKGSIKSLGAWGGDFVIVTSQANPSDYFRSKGFETVIAYTDLIK